jgi:CheY-like chemotaxis protein
MQYMEEEILKGKTLLVVDDEVDLRDIVASELEFMGARVFQAENIARAEKILDENKIDLIISDIRMPGGTGVDLLDAVKIKNVSVPPVLLITGFADITTEDAFNKGAEALINKPFKLDDLIKMVIRYTSSFGERFKEPETTLKSVQTSAIDTTKVRFGRGGLAWEILTEGKRFDVGELIRFSFDYGSDHYEGVGICRWVKAVDHSFEKAIMGIEFMNLSDQSIKSFQTMNSRKTTIPYIPAVY